MLTQFLRESETNSVVLRMREDGAIEALAFESLSNVGSACSQSTTGALELLSNFLGGVIEPTIPANELPDFCPEILDASGVAHV